MGWYRASLSLYSNIGKSTTQRKFHLPASIRLSFRASSRRTSPEALSSRARGPGPVFLLFIPRRTTRSPRSASRDSERAHLLFASAFGHRRFITRISHLVILKQLSAGPHRYVY